MDKDRFREGFPGSLVRVTNSRGEDDWGFVPCAVPQTVRFSSRIDSLLREARACLGTLNGIGRQLRDPNLLLRPLQIREALTSSSLEGTYVSPSEFLFRDAADKDNFAINTSEKADWQEVDNYGKSLVTGMEMVESYGLSLHLVRSMHRKLMHGVRGQDKSPGDFRKIQVFVGSTGRYIPCPPEHVSGLMDDWIEYMNGETKHTDPLVRACLGHYQIEAIHPFKDGNGRIGRALLALYLYNALGHTKPWLYMSAYFEKYKEEYVEKLFNVSSRGDWESWLEFCLNGTIIQARDSIRRCDEFGALRKEFVERAKGRGLTNNRTHEILDHLFVTPALTIPWVAEALSISRPTARREIQRLVECGILSETDKERKPKIFFSREVMKIAYDGDIRAASG